MAEKRIRSLEPILEQVRHEREAQLRHFDALDAKAGIILGFAGATVALAPAGGLLVDLGRTAAAISGLLALWTFWPRGHGVVELRPLRDLYLTSEPEFTRLKVLDTQIEIAERLGASLQTKAQWLKLSMAALALAPILTATGLGLN